jgi:hypothetical protein
MTWFDSLRALTGDQSDPIQEMKDYANRQQAQNRAAIGMDANGNPLPAGAAAAGVPQQLSPGQQATVAAHAASTLPPQQEPNATKTPPSLGATFMDLARYEQREQGFNQAMGGAFASVSQPRNRDWVRGIFNVNPLDAAKSVETVMNLGSQQQGQDRSNAIGQMINSPQGKALADRLNISTDELKARYLADPAGVGRMIETHSQLTDAQRNLGAAQTAITAEVKSAHPDWTDAQVQAEVNRRAPPEMLLSGVAGGDLEQQQYFQEAAGQRARGEPVTPYAEWKAGHQAQAIESATHARDVTEARDAAVQDYPRINQKLTENEKLVDQLLADPDHTLTALTTPLPTTGVKGAWDYLVSPETKAQAITLNTLRASLTGAGLSDVKNLRNRTEFEVLGQAATGGLDAANSKETLIKALQTIKRKFESTRAIAREQAGMKAEEAPKETLSDDDLIKKYAK